MQRSGHNPVYRRPSPIEVREDNPDEVEFGWKIGRNDSLFSFKEFLAVESIFFILSKMNDFKVLMYCSKMVAKDANIKNRSFAICGQVINSCKYQALTISRTSIGVLSIRNWSVNNYISNEIETNKS